MSVQPLRVLIVEDAEYDALLLVEHLQRSGYQVRSHRVETADGMSEALARGEWDVILADYRMPRFNAPAALRLLQASGRDVPFIIVSGTIGEETAVEALKAGAHDFMVKGSLARLAPAIERELRDARVRRERSHAEAALRKSEERYRGLLEGVPAGIYRTAPDGTVLDANTHFFEMLGLQDRSATGTLNVLSAYADPAERERWRAAVEAGQGVAGVEFQVRRTDGQLIWVRDTCRAVREPGGDGGVRYYEGVLEDITQLRAAQEESRRAEARFRGLIENTSDLIAVFGADRRARYVSPSYERVLGYSVDEALAADLFELIHPEDRDAVLGVFADLVQGAPGSRRVVSFRFRHKDGTWKYLESSGTSLLRDPAVEGVVVNTRDLTERVQLEEQYRQAQKMEAVGRLAGGGAHDFNNLLTVIAANAAFVLEDLGPNDPRRRGAVEIERAAGRAASLPRQLLAFSRRQVLQPRVLDVNGIVADMDKMLRRLIGEDIELRTVLAAGLPPVLADPGQMEQVILNLSVNARDAMPDGGKLTIETRAVDLDADYAGAHDIAAGAYIMIAVSDTGGGMSRQTQLRIFEPFFTTKAHGTGLGLATVYGIVKQSEGHVAVYSEAGHGTTFKVYLPATDQAAAVRQTAELPTSTVPASETVLLVEDEPAVRAVATRVLREAGYTVVGAACGPAAVAVAEVIKNFRLVMLCSTTVEVQHV